MYNGWITIGILNKKYGTNPKELYEVMDGIKKPLATVLFLIICFPLSAFPVMLFSATIVV